MREGDLPIGELSMRKVEEPTPPSSMKEVEP
jgi:hypothetical protein